MSQPPDKGAPFDPLGFWRSAQDATLDNWSKTMIELVNSQPYAEATARMMDTYLTMSIPMRKLLTQTMEQALGEFNMPTRGEVVAIAERMTNIEMRLDDLDARLDDFARQLAAVASAVASLAEGQRQVLAAAAESRPAAKAAAAGPAAKHAGARAAGASATGKAAAVSAASEKTSAKPSAKPKPSSATTGAKSSAKTRAAQ